MRDLTPYMSGSTEPWAVDVLTALIYAHEPSSMLELGTFNGMTTFEMAKAALPLTPFTTVEKDYERFMKARKYAGVAFPHIDFVQADAIAFLRDCINDGVSYDFVFVDDDHTYAHVAEEVELLKEIVPEGGVIVMHDVIGPFGLDKIVNEHGGIIVDLPLLHAAGGLGILRV